MTLWEIGKLREGWVSANTSKKEDGPKAGYASEEEFEAIMAMEINEAEDEGSFADFMESEKARQ